MYAYLRQDSIGTFVVVLNFDDKQASLTIDLGATSLPDGRYVVTNALTKQSTNLDGLTLKLTLDPITGYVFQLKK